MIPLIRKKYPNIKIIWFNHGDLSQATPAGRELMQEYLAKADAAIFSWREEYIPSGDVGAPTVFMIHGIDQENAKNLPLERPFIDAVAEKYGIDSKRPVLLHVGRYNLTKDPLRTIAAYLKLKEKLMARGVTPEKMPQLVIIGISLATADWKLYEELTGFAKSLKDSDIHIIASDNVATEYTSRGRNFKKHGRLGGGGPGSMG